MVWWRQGTGQATMIMLAIALGFLVLQQSAAVEDFPSLQQHDSTPHPKSSRSSSRMNTRLSPQQTRRLVSVKIYCLLIVLVLTMVAGVSPYFMRWRHAFLVLGVQFAGGVFMSTALLHFLSDSNDKFKELSSSNEYPFAFMLAVSGYLLTLTGDQTVHHVQTRKSRREEQELQLSWSASKEIRLPMDNLGASENGKSLKTKLSLSAAANASDVRPNNEGEDSSIDGSARAANHIHLTCCKCADLEAQLQSNLAAIRGTVQPSTPSFADAILLVLALCFHSVFEGLAIGIAATPYDAWRNLWTVLLHKVLAAMSMSIALLRIIPDRPFISVLSYAFGFAVSTPIGIAIGIVIDSLASDRTAEWAYTITMGLASGVFLFVAINHLLNKGYDPPEKVTVDTPLYKISSIFAGASLIFLAMYFDQ